jgi:hypothetical protein
MFAHEIRFLSDRVAVRKRLLARNENIDSGG